jgi:hypothetical protein
MPATAKKPAPSPEGIFPAFDTSIMTQSYEDKKYGVNLPSFFAFDLKTQDRFNEGEVNIHGAGVSFSSMDIIRDGRLHDFSELSASCALNSLTRPIWAPLVAAKRQEEILHRMGSCASFTGFPGFGVCMLVALIQGAILGSPVTGIVFVLTGLFFLLGVVGSLALFLHPAKTLGFHTAFGGEISEAMKARIVEAGPCFAGECDALLLICNAVDGWSTGPSPVSRRCVPLVVGVKRDIVTHWKYPKGRGSFPYNANFDVTAHYYLIDSPEKS